MKVYYNYFNTIHELICGGQLNTNGDCTIRKDMSCLRVVIGLFWSNNKATCYINCTHFVYT